MAMTLFSSVTVSGSSTNSVVFNNIPQNAKDLLLIVSARSASPNTTVNIHLVANNLPGFTYNQKRLRGDASSVTSTDQPTGNSIFHPQMPGASATSNVFGISHYYISNYTTSGEKTYNVTSMTENNDPNPQLLQVTGNHSNSGAIQRLDFYDGTGASFVAGSIFTVYLIS